jgi:hypothetical protein
MRTVLRILGSRYGIAVILAVVVLGIVGVTKAFISDGTSRVPIGPAVSPIQTAAAPDASLGDDSVDDPPSSDPQPSLSANGPTAKTVASRFVTAWLKHDGVSGDQWRSSLKPNATASLMDKLKDTDPSEVPADAVVGELTVENQGSVAVVTVPVNGGSVQLRVIAAEGRWKVDGIDWDPS